MDTGGWELGGGVRGRTALFAAEELFQVSDQFGWVRNLDGGDGFVVLAFQLGDIGTDLLVPGHRIRNLFIEGGGG